ncbi:50S ribosomal protein L1 [Candidatus Saccharibacteria bacterium CG11_big_fil_rev_8_21_14_0_20_41_19]|nr:MAG: 50S ribosomal protein L1 [Candidatus Saccharibacteria bacterium CG11_big_fil_rev_8_21_14_0_20_41_19]PIZ59926.1 MAG: 50S ribosomal protein L1 [Candidatus Saccharibacteria bacterium CG_4_10_14_0_2_um_filter_41_11]PJC29709.1 MAG: 50S ribosomal protein L1 [Candidatus Saccharibacteria bacterium CG_4_9_14_0_2_um_filter_41_9]PJE65988.1 MAG: 50S ribosomal protein L1 [Candidatus Saccharibacteria bacterium CG10_big_fil_rev_8_21_14_0_10_41_32]
MTKTKPELLDEAAKLKLEVSDKNTIAEINEAIKISKKEKVEKSKEVIAEREAVVAKAGKRSEKAKKEAEEKEIKEERKEAGDTTPQSADAEARGKKGPKPVTRPLIERRGKSYRKVAVLVDKAVVYSLADAMELAVKTNPSKFDASVEIHVRMGVDPRQADQNVRATVSLPNGTGKTIRVAVFAPETDHAAAKKAGADVVGDDDFLKTLEKGEINFDILIATPQYMPKLGKYARLLGPKGLMPNPKSGSVSTNVAKAVTEAKAGKVEYRVDKQAIVHLSIGKVSFGAAKLVENANAFFDSLKAQKPNGLKGSYVKTTSISTTQGPGIKVENVAN